MLLVSQTIKTSHFAHGKLFPASGPLHLLFSLPVILCYLSLWLVPSHPSKGKCHLLREVCPDHPTSGSMPLFSTLPPAYCLDSYSSVQVLSKHLFICLESVSSLDRQHHEGKDLTFLRLNLLYLHGAWRAHDFLWSTRMRGLRLVNSGRIHSVTTFSERLATLGPFCDLRLCVLTHSLSYSGFIWKPKCCLMTRKHEI